MVSFPDHLYVGNYGNCPGMRHIEHVTIVTYCIVQDMLQHY